jgi:hypothetical protein
MIARCDSRWRRTGAKGDGHEGTLGRSVLDRGRLSRRRTLVGWLWEGRPHETVTPAPCKVQPAPFIRHHQEEPR